MTTLRESFVREGPMWRAVVAVDGRALPVIVSAGRKGPDEAILTLIQSVSTELKRWEEEARASIRSLAPEHASKTLLLSALTAAHPPSAWKPEAGVSVARDQPIFSLQFEIHGELDILEVTFSAGRPVEVEYH